MALKYCQSHKCHTYDTKDRKRGSKGNRTNQTRRRSDFYYGKGNFCSLNCYNDWAEQFMDRAIDSVSGRIVEPKILTIENGWRKIYNHAHWQNSSLPRYIERNIISGETRNCEQQFHLSLMNNLWVLSYRGVCQLTKNATHPQVENFLFFFWVGPPKKNKLRAWVGPPIIYKLQAVKKIIFIFLLI